jgi:hypothetical protein
MKGPTETKGMMPATTAYMGGCHPNVIITIQNPINKPMLQQRRMEHSKQLFTCRCCQQPTNPLQTAAISQARGKPHAAPCTSHHIHALIYISLPCITSLYMLPVAADLSALLSAQHSLCYTPSPCVAHARCNAVDGHQEGITQLLVVGVFAEPSQHLNLQGRQAGGRRRGTGVINGAGWFQ